MGKKNESWWDIIFGTTTKNYHKRSNGSRRAGTFQQPYPVKGVAKAKKETPHKHDHVTYNPNNRTSSWTGENASRSQNNKKHSGKR